MKKNIVLSVLFLHLLVACSGSPNEVAIKEWVQEQVAECKGEVKQFTLIREGLLSNKFVGYAEISIKNKKYYPDIIVYSDDKKTFYQLQSNPCSIASFR